MRGFAFISWTLSSFFNLHINNNNIKSGMQGEWRLHTYVFPVRMQSGLATWAIKQVD
jgi:hypothetical protein